MFLHPLWSYTKRLYAGSFLLQALEPFILTGCSDLHDVPHAGHSDVCEDMHDILAPLGD